MTFNSFSSDKLLRLCLIFVFTAIAALVQAQNVLTPKWVANGWVGPAERPKFSADGSRVVVWESDTNYYNYYAWAVYNVADGTVLAHYSIDDNNGTLTGIALSPDGSTVYYGTTTGIYSYNISTQAQSRLPSTGASANNGAQYLDVSSDGTKLGYILEDPVSTDNLIIFYSLTSQSVLKRIDIKNSATSNHTVALKLIANGSEAVVSGPTVYSSTGTQLYAGTVGNSDIAVSPDESKIFTADNNFGGGAYGFSISNGTVTALWGPVSTPGFLDSGAVTSDNQAVLFTGNNFTGQDVGQWLVYSLSASTGSTLPTLSIPRSNMYNEPYIAAIPNSNQILVGPETSGYGGEPGGQVWNYSSSDGTGSLVGNLFEGNVVYGNPTIAGVSATVSGQSVPAIVETEYHAGGDLVTIRNASNGKILSQLPVGSVVSPNGQYYALASGDGVTIYAVADGSYIDSTTITNTYSLNVQWGGNQTLAIDGNGNGPFIYTFDGSSLSAIIQTFSFNGAPYKISPDGTKLAEFSYGNFNYNYYAEIDLFNVTTAAAIGKILADPNGNGIDDLNFSQTNRLGVHDTFYSGSSTYGKTVEYRVFDISTTSPTLIRSFSYQAGAAIVGDGGGLSPDGQIVALGHSSSSTTTDPRLQGTVNIYSVANGAQLNQWTNQFVPYFYIKYSPFAFSPDSTSVLWAADYALVSAPIVPFQMSLALAPSSVFGGTSSTGTVTVNPAQSSDIVFQLSSASSSVTVPSSVTVLAGSTSASFTVMTSQLSAGAIVPITASYNGSNASAKLTINPYTVASLSLSPTTVAGGTSSTGTVTVSPTPGANGATVTLSVNGTDAQVPATVLVPGGSSSATFTITTNGVTVNKTLTVSAAIGASKQTANLNINAPAFSNLSVSPTSVVGGTLSTGTVTLTGNAPTGGIVIGLASNSGNATVPQSVTVAAGKNTATFTISTTGVLKATTATITGTYVGSVTTTTQQATLTIQVPPVLSVSASPSTVVGGSQTAVTGTVTLGGIAASAGDVVTLTSSNPAVVSVPGTVTVLSGVTSATFAITTSAVTTSQSVTLTASFNGTSQQTILTVNPFTVSSVSLNPTSVLSGSPSTATVTISNAPATVGVTVTLSVSNTDAQVPATVVIPVGATSATFQVTTLPVSASETITVTAAIGASQQSAKLNLTGARITALSVAPATVNGGTGSTGTVTISQAAPTGGVVVNLTSSAASATVPTTVTVPSGSTTTTFNISTSGVATSTTATITGTIGTSTQSASLTIQPATLASLAIAPASVIGGAQSTATGTVTIAGVSAPNGDTVSISSSNPAVASAQPLVVVNGNAVTATFTISTQSVTTSQTVTFTATFNGVSKTATLTVQPFQVTGLTVNPSSVTGGVSSTGTVTISQAAGTSGAVVSLGTNSSDVSVPTSVVIPSGATSATFNISSNGVSKTEMVTITATAGASSKTAVLTLIPPVLTGLSITPSTVVGGSSSQGTVTLSGVAPASGMTVSLASSSTNAVAPKSVTVPGGSSTGTFTITTHGVSAITMATVTASLIGSKAETATLTLDPPTLVGLTLSATSAVGGSNTVVTGTVTLSGFGATAGDKVTLTSSNPKVATVPVSVTVPSGSDSASFTVLHLLVTSAGTTTITAKFNSQSQSVVLSVNPFQLTSLTLSPSILGGTESSTGTATLNASPGTRSGSVVVKLASSSKSATIPATVVVALNASAGTFTVKTTNVTSVTTATITGTYNGGNEQAALTIQPTPTLASVSVSPSTVQGISTTKVVGTVTLTGVAPAGGLVVKLSSSLVTAATVPASVTIPAGSSSVTFAVSHSKVTAKKSVNITAVLNGKTGTTTLTVTP